MSVSDHMLRPAGAAAVALVLATLAGCPSKPVIRDTLAPRVAELTVTIASLDLAPLNRRLTSADVSDLWKVVQAENIEIVTVHNLTRYPGLRTRIDLVQEFGSRSGWRTAFGELADHSGAQNGNAVFSLYPVRSHAVRSFSTVRGAFDEGAVIAVVDAGVRDFALASANFPEKAGETGKRESFGLLAQNGPTASMPMIISGNLPGGIDGWVAADSAGAFAVRSGPMVEPTRSWTVRSRLGTLRCVSFAFFRQTATEDRP